MQFNPQHQITEVRTLVKFEGTVDELRQLLGRVETVSDVVAEKATAVKKTAKKTKRKLNSWQRYIKNPANHIKIKSGKRKGQLDLKKMSRVFKRVTKK